MKRLLIVVAFLAFAGESRRVIGQTDIGDWIVRGNLTPFGYGCITGNDGQFEIFLEIRVKGPGAFAVRQGHVGFLKFAPFPRRTDQPRCSDDGHMRPSGVRIYRIDTANTPNVPKVESFTPRGPRPELRVSSPGRCGPKATDFGTITATMTPNYVTIRCGAYAVAGTAKPGISFELARCQDPSKSIAMHDKDPWMRVFTGGSDPSDPSIQMSARCRSGHFVQFVKRDGPRGTYYDTVGGRRLEYGRWNLDTLKDGPSPYYDDYGPVVRNACVWISDKPLTQTASRSGTAHFVTFAICDNIPVRRFEWDRLPDGKYVAPKEPQPTNLAELCAFYRDNDVPESGPPKFPGCGRISK